MPRFILRISNPEGVDLSKGPVNIKIPKSAWQSIRGSDPWDPSELDNMNFGSDGHIIKWPDFAWAKTDEYWALARFETSNPNEVNVYWGTGIGSGPQDVFTIWREFNNEDIPSDEYVCDLLDPLDDVVDESKNTQGTHEIASICHITGAREYARRDYSDQCTYFHQYTSPSLINLIRMGYTDQKWFLLRSYNSNSGGWPQVATSSGVGQGHSIYVKGTSMKGKVCNYPRDVHLINVKYDWYDYETDSLFEWEREEAPWWGMNPRILDIDTPTEVLERSTITITAHTSELNSLYFDFNGNTYYGEALEDDVFTVQIPMPRVEVITEMELEIWGNGLSEISTIKVYPRISESRLKFLRNGSVISDLTMERGQVEFVDIHVEAVEGDTASRVSGPIMASIVSYDGQDLEQLAFCEVNGNRVKVFVDLPVGVYYLQILVDLDTPRLYQRIQRMKLKVVVDRK